MHDGVPIKTTKTRTNISTSTSLGSCLLEFKQQDSQHAATLSKSLSIHHFMCSLSSKVKPLPKPKYSNLSE